MSGVWESIKLSARPEGWKEKGSGWDKERREEETRKTATGRS